MAAMTLVRIYIMEAEKQLQPLLSYLHNPIKVRGVTVFRGITGFGRSGEVHSSHLLDLSLNLPIVVEFFDTPSRVEEILLHLNTFIEPGHIVSWPVDDQV